MNSLPLSWSYRNRNVTKDSIITRWNVRWLAMCASSSLDISHKLGRNSRPMKDTLIRGCSAEIKNNLEKKGFRSILVGKEAVLNTNGEHFAKKSLGKLIKRGLRHGTIISIPFNEKNKKKLYEFRKQAVHGKAPQLKNLFKMDFGEENLLNVFIDKNGIWLGAIMLSKNSFEKLHTELLLRRVETPVGVMEALIEHTFNFAKYHGFSELSLGEVPFIRTAAKNSDLHSTILEDMGRLFNFAYNFEGLYNFKNKFRPEWKDLYICANNGIKMKHLFFLFVNTNFHNLAIHKLILKVKRLLSYLNIPYNRFFILRKLDFNKT